MSAWFHRLSNASSREYWAAQLRRHKGLLIALSILAFVFFAVPALLRVLIMAEATIRFRVHAQLTDDGVPFEGSAVWELYVAQARVISHDRVTSVRGEAIPLHGPGGRNLFLLRVPEGGGSSLVYGDYPMLCVPGEPKTNVEMVGNMANMFTGPCAVTERRRPPLVVEIPDLTNPASMRPIPYTFAPAGACEGVCLTELWVERTDEPLTTGIMDLLPWLKAYRLGMTDVVTGNVPKTERGGEGTVKLMDFTTEFPGGKSYE